MKGFTTSPGRFRYREKAATEKAKADTSTKYLNGIVCKLHVNNDLEKTIHCYRFFLGFEKIFLVFDTGHGVVYLILCVG